MTIALEVVREAFARFKGASLVLLLQISLCAAQSGGPKDFYGNDYAKTVGDLSTRGAQPVAGAQLGNRAATKNTDGGQGLADTASLNNEAGVGKTKKRRILVSVLVNSRDKAHFGKVIEEVLKLSDTKAGFITQVSHIGDYTTVTDEVERELSRRGIAVNQTDVPPQGLSLTVSPAWQVQTKDGLHVVEGVLSLDRFIDEWGEFDPKRYQSFGDDVKAEGF